MNPSKIPAEDQTRIRQTLAPLAGMFPHWDPGDETIMGYIVTLADLDSLLLESAVFHLLSQPLKFMPTAGEIRHAAFDLRDGNGGPPDPYEAWAQVEQAKNNGAGNPLFKDRDHNVHPLVEKAVRYIGGWRNLAMSENHVSDRARFIDAYGQVKDREIEDQRMLPEVRDTMKALADQLAKPQLEKRKDSEG